MGRRTHVRNKVLNWIVNSFINHTFCIHDTGLKVTYLTDEKSVYDVEIRCLECESPSYFPLKDNEEYNLFVSDFLIRGGDGFSFEPIKRERFSKYRNAIAIAFYLCYDKFSNSWVAFCRLR